MLVTIESWINNGSVFKTTVRISRPDNLFYTRDCRFTPYNEFTDHGPNVWWTIINGIKVYIKQPGYWMDINEGDIQFDTSQGNEITFDKQEIVTAFNGYVSRLSG